MLINLKKKKKEIKRKKEIINVLDNEEKNQNYKLKDNNYKKYDNDEKDNIKNKYKPTNNLENTRKINKEDANDNLEKNKKIKKNPEMDNINNIERINKEKKINNNKKIIKEDRSDNLENNKKLKKNDEFLNLENNKILKKPEEMYNLENDKKSKNDEIDNFENNKKQSEISENDKINLKINKNINENDEFDNFKINKNINENDEIDNLTNDKILKKNDKILKNNKKPKNNEIDNIKNNKNMNENDEINNLKIDKILKKDDKILKNDKKSKNDEIDNFKKNKNQSEISENDKINLVTNKNINENDEFGNFKNNKNDKIPSYQNNKKFKKQNKMNQNDKMYNLKNDKKSKNDEIDNFENNKNQSEISENDKINLKINKNINENDEIDNFKNNKNISENDEIDNFTNDKILKKNDKKLKNDEINNYKNNKNQSEISQNDKIDNFHNNKNINENNKINLETNKNINQNDKIDKLKNINENHEIDNYKNKKNINQNEISKNNKKKKTLINYPNKTPENINFSEKKQILKISLPKNCFHFYQWKKLKINSNLNKSISIKSNNDSSKGLNKEKKYSKNYIKNNFKMEKFDYYCSKKFIKINRKKPELYAKLRDKKNILFKNTLAPEVFDEKILKKRLENNKINLTNNNLKMNKNNLNNLDKLDKGGNNNNIKNVKGKVMKNNFDNQRSKKIPKNNKEINSEKIILKVNKIKSSKYSESLSDSLGSSMKEKGKIPFPILNPLGLNINKKKKNNERDFFDRSKLESYISDEVYDNEILSDSSEELKNFQFLNKLKNFHKKRDNLKKIDENDSIIASEADSLNTPLKEFDYRKVKRSLFYNNELKSLFFTSLSCCFVFILSSILWIVLFKNLIDRNNFVGDLVLTSPTLEDYHDVYTEFYIKFDENKQKMMKTEEILEQRKDDDYSDFKKIISDFINFQNNINEKLFNVKTFLHNSQKENIYSRRILEEINGNHENNENGKIKKRKIQANKALGDLNIIEKKLELMGRNLRYGQGKNKIIGKIYEKLLVNMRELYANTFILIDIFGKFFKTTNRIWVSTENIFQYYYKQAQMINEEIEKTHFKQIKTEGTNLVLQEMSYLTGAMIPEIENIQINSESEFHVICSIKAEVNNTNLEMLNLTYDLFLISNHNTDDVLDPKIRMDFQIRSFNRRSTFYQILTLQPGHNNLQLFGVVKKGDIKFNHIIVECLTFENYKKFSEFY